MGTASITAAGSLALAALLLVGCGSPSAAPASTPSAPDVGAHDSPRGSSSDPQVEAPLPEQLVAARSGGDPRQFASLVSRAAATCSDPDAARQLGQLSAVAERWADSIAVARPKAQARTEAQLDQIDWAALVEACAGT
jgi:hypothetical protein